MVVNYNFDQNNRLFDNEIKLAINWLLKVRDTAAKGWAWVQFIAPNEQNTAEVISALLENNSYLTNDMYFLIVESVKEWLLNPINHAKISIDWSWVLLALLKIKADEKLSNLISQESIDVSIAQCIQWLLINQNDDGGWADVKGDFSTTSRTALSLISLNKAILYTNDNAEIKNHIKIGVAWLLKNQNSDGGWGNMRETDIDRNYQNMLELPYADLKYQCDSNASCTGYALLALFEDVGSHRIAIGNGAKFIKKSQNKLGGWDVFSEVGIRSGNKYTFRHFSTTWALKALLYTQSADYRDECILHGINYLIQLQDNYYGGWKSSFDADNYTWATCNALETIRLIKTQLSEVKAKQFLQIVWDWWSLKKKESSFSLQLGRVNFAFNSSTCLLFCVIFTVMMLFIAFFASDYVSTVLSQAQTENTIKLINGIVLVVGSFIIGLPWVVFVKNVFKRDMESWINSFGWVYGIITGFLLAFYQFIL